MINKINAINFISKPTKLKKQVANNNIGIKTSQELAGSKYLGVQQAIAGVKPTISFGAEKRELTEFEKSLILPKEIRIPNILDIPGNIDIPLSAMPPKTGHLNAAGLKVEKTIDGDSELYTISNGQGDRIFAGKINRKEAGELPIVTYKQGKFMPEITVKDSSLNGKSIKMLAGSEIRGKGFDFRMIGHYEPKPNGENHEIVSFKGNTVITTLNKEDRTLNAVDSYKKSGLQKEAIKGDYYDEVKADNPTIVIPAGGFGERFYNITRDAENKPSGFLPTSKDYRIIATTLNMAASAGILNGDETDSIHYLSQAHDIPENETTTHVSKYKTDGGAIAEGVNKGIINRDKASVILNADIFTNTDITRIYHALKTLPNAALVIPYYPVSAERASSFGLIGIEKDKNGNLEIKEFIEKPKFVDNPPKPTDTSFVQPGSYDKAMQEFLKVQKARNPEDRNKFLANPGFYFLSPQAQKVLVDKWKLKPEETGLGAHVMPKIVELANEGKLTDENGNQMKVYTVPLETKGGKPAVWDDIGTAEAYLRIIKDVANEYTLKGNTSDNKYYGVPEFVMKDFAANTDLERGIVFDSKLARDSFGNFCQKHEVKSARGNIFVAGNNR